MSTTEVLQPIANHALTVYPYLLAPGFECSKVFALTALYLANPPVGFPSPGYLRKNLASLYLFVVHPSQRSSSGVRQNGAKMIPELWYINVTRRNVEIGRGRPSTKLLGLQRRPEIIIETDDRSLMNLATGKERAQRLYETRKLKIRGKLDKALEISRLIEHQRSKLYTAASTDPTPRSETETTFNEVLHDYSIGSGVRSRL
ncbi:hypothetical protein MSPP1_001004 [Malassezia sp. CBS 17886]|nr:hypothetical protein MSPP1_001004 [Malassezia sp. CBS 17886]